MTNLYHVYHTMPALEKEDMFIELEHLALSLVRSGLLRIDANEKCNFARVSYPQSRVNMMLSIRELTDPELIKSTQSKLSEALTKTYGRTNLTQINNTIAKLIKDIDKFHKIDENLELKLARIIVQSAHPVVTLLILLERVEVFLSYSYNIADLLDVVTWQTAGDNGGMQSTNGKDVAIFVSAGGDPLNLNQDKISTNFDEERYGDGKPAIARILVIAGQEMGHYSDIMRDKYGRQYTRHSADFGGRRAKPHVKIARINDMSNIDRIWNDLRNFNISNVIEFERRLKFFRKNKVRSFLTLYTWIKLKYLTRKFFIRSINYNFVPLLNVVKNKYPAYDIFELVKDMRFNLAPEADVYKNDDKNIEEAIACIEALARIPQQVNKWGHKTTKYFMPNLYKIYYQEVIPSCIKDYENLTKKKFIFYPENFSKISNFKRYKIKSARYIKNKIKKIFKKND